MKLQPFAQRQLCLSGLFCLQFPPCATIGPCHKPYRPPSAANGAQSARLWDVLFRPATREQSNQRNVLIDGIGVGITAGVGSFLSVFLVRMGASSFLVGLLTAMPALTGMLMAIPVGEFLARRPNIVPWFARSRFVVLSCYVLTGLVPFSSPAAGRRSSS